MREPCLQREWRIDGSGDRLLERLLPALSLLKTSSLYALDVQVDRWAFAINIGDLCSAGLTTNDLRWLICKGYVDHAVEIASSTPTERRFEFSPEFTFRSCFVLTPAGQLLCESVSELGVSGTGAVAQHVSKPEWRADSRELWHGVVLVKRFRSPAPNQILVLMAFEEEDWPTRIYDPLPPRDELDGKRRLHDTVNALNRFQKQPILRFRGDGSGEGIRWETAAFPLAGAIAPLSQLL